MIASSTAHAATSAKHRFDEAADCYTQSREPERSIDDLSTTLNLQAKHRVDVPSIRTNVQDELLRRELIALAHMTAAEKGEGARAIAGRKMRLDLELLRELAPACGFEVRQVATRLGISRRQLERLFNTQLASTPDSWLREERLQCARRMLLSVARVKTVAYALGFRQPSQFARDFKARFGLTPSSFIDHEHKRLDDDVTALAPSGSSRAQL